MMKSYSAACNRNRAPILSVLRDIFSGSRRVLEIGSGTGEHAIFFGEHLPHLVWQTSDLAQNHASILAWQQDAQLANLLPPLVLNVTSTDWPAGPFDAVFSANTCHIMAWQDVEKMFAGIARILSLGGVAAIYGPFNYEGSFSSPGNAQFDATLRAQAPHMGIRDFEAVNALAAGEGLILVADYSMPANNRLLVWRSQTQE